MDVADPDTSDSMRVKREKLAFASLKPMYMG